MQRIIASFQSFHGWTLVLLAVGGAISAIASHLTGNYAADATTILAVIGILTHPTTPSNVV